MTSGVAYWEARSRSFRLEDTFQGTDHRPEKRTVVCYDLGQKWRDCAFVGSVVIESVNG